MATITWNEDAKRYVPPAMREEVEAGEYKGTQLVHDAQGDVFYRADGGSWHVGELHDAVPPGIVELPPPPAPAEPVLDEQTKGRLASLEASIGTLTEVVGKLLTDAAHWGESVRLLALAQSAPAASSATPTPTPITSTPGA